MGSLFRQVLDELTRLKPDYFTFSDLVEGNISRVFIITEDRQRYYFALKNTTDPKQLAQEIIKVIDGKERYKS